MRHPIHARSTFVSWALAASLVAQEAADEGAQARLLESAGRRLAACGYDVPDGVRCETRKARDVIQDLDAQQDALMPSAAFGAQHALFAGLGIPAGRDQDALRDQLVAAMARGISAYYDPLRKVFVLLPTATRDVSEMLGGGLGPLVTHELVHAHQDARDGGIVGFFAADRATLDEVLARRVTLEGEAELVAALAIGGEQALARLATTQASGVLDRLFAGEMTGQIYEAGRRLALARHAQGGIEGVRALWNAPPASTEQALHVDKYGVDLPTSVQVPAIEGLVAAHATTMGELMVYSVLRQLKMGRLDAAIAAAGWDGDRFVAYDQGEDENALLVWRTVWDREQDAADFARCLGRDEEAQTVVDGRVVDWVRAADDALRARVVAALASDRPQPPASDEDAAGTAAAEASLRERIETSRAEGEVWQHPAFGLEVPIPAGWEVRDVNGVSMLVHVATAASGFAMNANVLSLPRGPIADLEAYVATNRSQLERSKFTVDVLEVTKRGDVDVVEGEYRGRVGNLPPMRFLLLAYLRADQQVMLTVTATESLWTRHEKELRALVAGVRVAPQ